MTEYVSAVAMQVLSADTAVVQAVAAGQLELNAFLPVVAHNLLGAIRLLRQALPRFREHCIVGITAAGETLRWSATAWVTALVPHLGYETACRVAACMQTQGCDVVQAAATVAAVRPEDVKAWLTPEKLLQLGHP
jgi:fumarate hydratase class II